MTIDTRVKAIAFLAATSFVISLGGCGKQTSAVAPATGSGADGAATQSPAAGGYGPGPSSYGPGPASDPRAAAVPQVNGKPMWAANRQHTAEENAQYQFGKNGADFASASESDYVRKAHAFIDNPPSGVESLDRRNGDKLLYDPKGNVFAVVSKDGAPRTMFKPRDGSRYWDEQKARLNGASSGRASDQNQG